jgi:hypothetical protein
VLLSATILIGNGVGCVSLEINNTNFPDVRPFGMTPSYFQGEKSSRALGCFVLMIHDLWLNG